MNLPIIFFHRFLTRNKSISRLLFTLITTLFSANIWAEGAVRVLACTFEQACDIDANCHADSGDIVFRMEPLNLDDKGSGRYVLSYLKNDENIQTNMEANSFAGPFFWNLGDEMLTLLANTETSFLLHSLKLTSSPSATIHFLACKFTQ